MFTDTVADRNATRMMKQHMDSEFGKGGWQVDFAKDKGFVQEFPDLAEWAMERDSEYAIGDEPDEWNGVVPDPYRDLDRFGKPFLATYLQHLNELVSAIANDSNPDYDMNFKMKCDECKSGWCDVTTGFDACACTMGGRKRKDGFYVGEF